MRSLRVLHVSWGLRRGGIETWLVHILRHIDREQFDTDVLVHTTEPCTYDEQVRRLGVNLRRKPTLPAQRALERLGPPA